MNLIQLPGRSTMNEGSHVTLVEGASDKVSEIWHLPPETRD